MHKSVWWVSALASSALLSPSSCFGVINCASCTLCPDSISINQRRGVLKCVRVGDCEWCCGCDLSLWAYQWRVRLCVLQWLWIEWVIAPNVWQKVTKTLMSSSFLHCISFPALWLHISSQRERERQREKEGQKGFRPNTKSWIELLSNYPEKSWRNNFHSEIAKFNKKKQQVTMN